MSKLELETCQEDLKNFHNIFNKTLDDWARAYDWKLKNEFDNFDQDISKQVEQLSNILQVYKECTKQEEKRKSTLKQYEQEATTIHQKAQIVVDCCLNLDRLAEDNCSDVDKKIDQEIARLQSLKKQNQNLMQEIRSRKQRLINVKTQESLMHQNVMMSVREYLACADIRIKKAEKSVEAVSSVIEMIPSLASTVNEEVQELNDYAEDLKRCIACDLHEAYAGVHKVSTIDKITQTATAEICLDQEHDLERKLALEETLLDSEDSVIQNKIQSIESDLNRMKESRQKCLSKITSLKENLETSNVRYAPVLEFLRTNSQSVTRDLLKIVTNEANLREWQGVRRNEASMRVLEMVDDFENNFREAFEGRDRRIRENLAQKYAEQGRISM
ncbi:hypothetical protein GUITHDRAFT_151683 [Guillardia theta CCMP2712]|uniref:Uncharacterized protein n=1 Tax=Guillardia theta (strain CCMP2712) TaxID=905079 RepID=L1JL41_GUITC|nr:hypothetical protein GUITHDRAFT_151683 [Guillardia theta CCMP2712]EKX48775.1 hypothetical protein GUITHDRAFT_151683 [Guillardia theta CCMP2712]|eukprot:XP_005835755.1 hypothetical protein GUITHDRAFT_151683 [Guillardia theta CCMP2712]